MLALTVATTNRHALGGSHSVATRKGLRMQQSASLQTSLVALRGDQRGTAQQCLALPHRATIKASIRYQHLMSRCQISAFTCAKARCRVVWSGAMLNPNASVPHPSPTATTLRRDNSGAEAPSARVAVLAGGPGKPQWRNAQNSCPLLLLCLYATPNHACLCNRTILQNFVENSAKTA
ncbi:hypothetical protein HRbin16_01922 [bacterium HR16]|nr:hypothetical protein HRbin16_01922 [bacterium HR16]